MTSSQNSVLIVDSDNDFRNSLCDSFQKIGWIVNTANDGRQAIQSMNRYLPDIILMNTKLQVRDGITTCCIIKNDVTAPRIFPIIMMTDSTDKNLIIKSIDSGCDDFILKPFQFDVLLNKVKSLVDFYQKKEGIGSQISEDEVEIIIQARQVIQKAFSNALRGELIDYSVIHNVVNKMVEILHKENNLPLAFKMKSYNDYTYIHSINVASLCMSFAYHLKWDDIELQIIGEGGFLHDIGKTLIDLKILMKPGKLTDTEFSEMKKHPLHGKDILVKQDIQDKVQKVVTEHHECIDGSGYPNKLRGEQFSKYGKLTAIVDVYDALTTDRCYQKAVDSEEAIHTMSNLSGKFDPELFQEFAHLVNSETIGK